MEAKKARPGDTRPSRVGDVDLAPEEMEEDIALPEDLPEEDEMAEDIALDDDETDADFLDKPEELDDDEDDFARP